MNLLEFLGIHSSINRNIVECKGTNKENIDSLVRVLIETSWNVKYCRLAASNHSACGINRNIVECKGIRRNDPLEWSKSINRNIVECKVPFPPSA